jgi:hypothetical protein
MTPSSITLSVSALEAIDLTIFAPYVPPQYHHFFLGELGYAPYRLLAYLSTQFKGEILMEVGVHHGWGSLAMSYNPNNAVFGYDIDLSTLDPVIPAARSNTWFRQGVVHEIDPTRVLASSFIHFDAAHDGVYEQVFLDFLIKHEYQGYVLWDDIHRVTETEGNAMDKFWNGITAGQRYDLTGLGHYTGSGLLCLGGTTLNITP